MASGQAIDAPPSLSTSATDVLSFFGDLHGLALEAALRYSAKPAGSALTIPVVRELLGVGVEAARTVLRQLKDAGFARVDWWRDKATGRLIGRRTVWTGPAPATPTAPAADHPEHATSTSGPGQPASGLTADQQVGPERAMALLNRLGVVDPRLIFASRELEGLVPLVVAHLEAGTTEPELVTLLTVRLPGRENLITTGLLHHRLTKALPAEPCVTADRPSGHQDRASTPAPAAGGTAAPRPLVECADCGTPSRELTPGALCRACRGEPESHNPAEARALARARIYGRPGTEDADLLRRLRDKPAGHRDRSGRDDRDGLDNGEGHQDRDVRDRPTAPAGGPTADDLRPDPMAAFLADIFPPLPRPMGARDRASSSTPCGRPAPSP